MRTGGAPVPAENRTASWLQRTLFAGPLVALVAVGWVHRCIIDDGFIYLRVVRQMTSGHGPVFNRGERVEAFTGPLWVAVLSVTDALTPARLEWSAVVLGILFTTAGAGLAMLGAARLTRQHNADALLFPVGIVALVAVTPMWFYASSGLETGLVFLWMGASLWILASWSQSGDRMPTTHAVVLGLAVLVRPELVVYTIAFLAIVIALQWRREGWRSRLGLIGAAVALPALYQIFRMGYYGSLVANTAIAKEGTHLRWERGWRYFTDFVGTYWLWIPVLVLAVGVYAPLARALRAARRRRALAVLAAFVGAGALNAVYVVAIGGDYAHARLLLPALFALCAPAAAVPITRRYLLAAAILPWVVVSAVALRPPDPGAGGARAVGKAFVAPTGRAGKVTIDDYGWGAGGIRRSWYQGPAFYVEQGAKYHRVNTPVRPGVHLPTVASLAIGVSSYALGDDFYVADVLGLADPLTAHLTAPNYTGPLPPPGHEKPLPFPWIAARYFAPNRLPPAAALPHVFFSLIPHTSGPEYQQQAAFARAALTCPAIARLTRSANSPLTPRRFVANIFHSFANTFLRIPPDPEQAFHRFCGSDAQLRVELTARAPGSRATDASTAASRREDHGALGRCSATRRQSSFSATALGVTFILGTYSLPSTARASPVYFACSSSAHVSQGPRNRIRVAAPHRRHGISTSS